MADPNLPLSGATQPNPVDPDNASSDDTSVDTIVVGVSGGDSGAGLVVGDPGLAANADSDGAAAASGALARQLLPVGSSGGADAAAQIGGSVVGGGITAESADSSAPGSQASINDVSGNSDPGPTVADGTAGITVVSGGGSETVAAGSGGASGTAISVATYVSDYNAVSNGTFTFPGDVYISDTAAHIESLTPGELFYSKIIGLTGITATDASVVFTSVAQALQLEEGNVPVTVPKNDTVTVEGTAANLEALTTAQLTALGPIGVTDIAATDTPAVMNATQMTALTNAKIPIVAPPNNLSQNDGTFDVYNPNGLTLDITWDPSVASAPASFETTVESGIAILESTILNQITVNLTVGYGETGGGADPANISSANDYTFSISYSDLRSALEANEITNAQTEAVNALPTGTTLNGVSDFNIGAAEAKALGSLLPFSPTYGTSDGYAGFGTGFTGTELVGAALHELTHAMGRDPGDSVLSLVRYTSPGNHYFGSGPPAPASYFSIDGGTTKLADFGKTSDPSDFLNGATGLTPNDPFDEGIAGDQLTPQDLTMIEVLGFQIDPIESFTASYIEGLSPGPLGIGLLGLAGDGLTALEASDASVVLTVAQAVAFENASLSLTAPSGDTVTIADTAANIEAMTPAQITGLYSGEITGLPSTNVTAIAATDSSVALTVALAQALVNGSIVISRPPGDYITVVDTVANILALTASETAAMASIGVTGWTIADTAVHIEAIPAATLADFPGVPIFGIVSTDASVVLTVDLAVAIEGDGIPTVPVTVPSGDTVTVADTAADIEGLTPAEITALPATGVTAVAATDASVQLTVAQAVAFGGASLSVTAPTGDTVTVADTAANIESLYPTGDGSIAGLPAIGVSAIRATDTSLVLTAPQAVALEAASLAVSVPRGDTVTIADQTGGGYIEELTAGEIDALPSIGVTAIVDTLNEFPLLLSVAQSLALEATGIPVSEDHSTSLNFPYVYDTAANIASLTAGEIAALPGIGIFAIWASDASDYPQGIPLSVAQAVALENASLFVRGPSIFSPVVDVADDASNLETLTAVQILKLPMISRGYYPPNLYESGPIYITSNGQPLGFTVAQVDAFLETGLQFVFAVEGGGAVTVSDTAADIESYISLHTQTQLQGLAADGFTGFAATDASLQLGVADALKLEGAALAATAPSGDTVTIVSVFDIATDIESLTPAEIAGLPAIGVTAITALYSSVQLSVAQALALEGAALVVTAPSGDTVTIADTIANVLSLTSGELSGLAAIGVTGVSVADTAADIGALSPSEVAALAALGVTTITASDASVTLTVAQALEIESDLLVVTAPAGDSVTIADTAADILSLTSGELAGLAAIGVTGLSVTDTAADIEALSAGQIAMLGSIGVTTITASDASVILTVGQAVALEGASLVVTAPVGDTVTVVDSAADIGLLTPAEIAALPSIGVTAIGATDVSVQLSVAQAGALEDASLKVTVPAGDSVTIADMAGDIEGLTPTEITALPATGVTAIAATDVSLQLTVAQVLALEGASLAVTAPTGDMVTIADTAGNIEGLTLGQITLLPAVGISAIGATDVSLQFTVAQALALEGASLTVAAPAGDSVTVVDTEANIDTLTAAETALLPAIGVSGIEVVSLSGLAPITIAGGITLTVDGGVSANQAITFTGAGGTLALADPTDMSGTVSGFAAPDTIDLTGALYDPSATPVPLGSNEQEIIEDSGNYFIDFDPAQDFLSENFVVGPDQGTGTDLNLVQVPLTSYAAVPAGETVYGITVANGGTVDVLAGGALSGGTVGNGGTLDVENGAMAAGATIEGGGTQNVAAGGTANDTVLDGSATQDVSGTASVTTVENGDSQTVEAGGLAISTTIESGGTATVFAGGTTSDTMITGAGTLDVQDGGVVSGGITFAGAGGLLEIDGTSLPTDPTPVIGGVISGFGSGDTIDLTGIGFDPAGSANLTSGNELQVTEGGNTYDLQFDPTQNFSGDYFHMGSDSASGTDITENNMPCYCRSTMILTEMGEVTVEDLAIGDRVVTISGAARPIKWIGRRSYDGRFVAANRAVLPIRVAAGALAEGVPARDLWVSPEHALYLDELLVPARLLVNGATITQGETIERVEYFHIELDAHDIIFAEGAPAESFVDCDNREMFQNGAEFAALYPAEAPVPWTFCAPRLEDGSAGLAAIRARLAERAAALGHALTRDPDLHLIVDGATLPPQAVEDEVYSFAVPAGSRALAITSRSAVPAETGCASPDRRRLGVPLRRIVLREDGLRIEIGHGHSSLKDGVHSDEEGHRWTDGLARLPESWLRPFPGAFTLEVHLAASALDYRRPPPARSGAGSAAA